MKSKQFLRTTIVILTLLAASLPVVSQDRAKKKDKKEARAEEASTLPAVLMEDPGDIASLDLYYGAGGKQLAPSPTETFTFVDEDLHQTSPKFDVTDSQGRRWRAKLGPEPQAETAATRLAWAAGYFVNNDYYLDRIKVENLPTLQRGSVSYPKTAWFAE